MEKEKDENIRNSAGEFLYYEDGNILDTSVEGTALENGFNNGLNAKGDE